MWILSHRVDVSTLTDWANPTRIQPAILRKHRTSFGLICSTCEFNSLSLHLHFTSIQFNPTELSKGSDSPKLNIQDIHLHLYNQSWVSRKWKCTTLWSLLWQAAWITVLWSSSSKLGRGDEAWAEPSRAWAGGSLKLDPSHEFRKGVCIESRVGIAFRGGWGQPGVASQSN